MTVVAEYRGFKLVHESDGYKLTDGVAFLCKCPWHPDARSALHCQSVWPKILERTGTFSDVINHLLAKAKSDG